MKFLSNNCEELLFEKIKSLKEQPHNSWRCLYFDHKGPYSVAVRQRWLTVALSSFSPDTDGYVYLCGDGDIFILFQGPVKIVLSELAEHFRHLYEKPYDVFDLGVHWHDFYHLCKSKFLHAQLLNDEVHSMRLPTPRNQVYSA